MIMFMIMMMKKGDDVFDYDDADDDHFTCELLVFRYCYFIMYSPFLNNYFIY